MNLTDATVRVAWYTFAPTENTYVRQIAPGQFELDLTTSSFRGVSGISQEGGRATVEAEIDVKLTPVYEGMTKIVQGQKCQSLWRVGTSGGEMAFARWPQSVNAGTQKGSYRFQRFDDGWRIVGR